jgi:hypothetical protein
MNIATRPVPYLDARDGGDWPDRYGWSVHHHSHGRTIWHAGPALIGMMVLGFIFFWPLGFIALAITIWSMKMTCGHHGGEGRWGERWQERMMARRARWEQRIAEHHGHHHRGSGTGNRAFDEYRAETLRRLEDEEKEFKDFLNQLRYAKDKVEFDDFLANRRPPAPPEPEAPSQN